MTNEKDLVKLEKEIRIKMISIRNKSITPKDSGIGKLINLMKSLDEPLHQKIMSEYKDLLKSLVNHDTSVF